MNGTTPAAQLSMDLDSIIAANRSGRGSSGAGRRGGRRPTGRSDRDRPGYNRNAMHSGITTASLSASASSGKTKISVTNLDRQVTEADLRELFRRVGRLVSVQLFYDKSGRSQGTAHIVYTNRKDALSAISQYNGVTLDGRPMRIEIVVSPDTFERQVLAPRVDRRGSFNRMNGGRGGPRRHGVRGGSRGGPRGGMRGGRRPRDPTKSATDLDADLDSYMAGRSGSNAVGGGSDEMQTD